MYNQVITGDNVAVLRQLPEGSVTLTVTSPPYDKLRAYNGYSFHFPDLAPELYRVTKPGGVVVWVVGDSVVKGSETGQSFRQALWMMEHGFKLWDTMIFAKKNPLPQSHPRYEQYFEYMFVFSKGRPGTFNGLRESCKTAGKVKDYGKSQAGSDSQGGLRRHRKETVKTKDEKLKGNIWYYAVGGSAASPDKEIYKHPATFPEALAKDHILSWSNPGDLVLDPFGGSGTTAKMALLTGRQYLHIDISEEYNDIARARLAKYTDHTH